MWILPETPVHDKAGAAVVSGIPLVDAKTAWIIFTAFLFGSAFWCMPEIKSKRLRTALFLLVNAMVWLVATLFLFVKHLAKT